ncbi:MAG: TetR/AcrR family transcriptional regulator [Thermodesulfobacteriota bacterium]
MIQPKAPTRREREKLRQRREILDAALALFSEKGFHSVSMHEIAGRSEFAIGTLYKFFKNKDALYKSLLVEQAGKFHQALTTVLREGDDEAAKLRKYVQTKAAVFMENAAFIRIYFSETRGASFSVKAGLDSDIRGQYEETVRLLAAVFESGMEKKRFHRIAEPYALAVALESLCNAFLFLWLETPEERPFPEDPDVILNILFKGLVHA